MSRAGHAALLVAAVLVVFVVATWGRGDRSTAEATLGRTQFDGASLFNAKGCATCHRGPDTRARFDGYPPLDDASSWAADRRPGMSAVEYLTESIAAPAVFSSPALTANIGPPNPMPRLRLTSEEIDALVAYLLAD